MKDLFFLLLIFSLCLGCRKSAGVETKDYSGEFILTNPANLPFTGRMHIQFSEVNFAGSGDSALLPYVGKGVFKVSGDSIYFTQTGSVPAIFEQTSILEGSFLLEKNMDSLVFTRKNAAGGLGPEIIYRLHRD